jgi:hypothetical protein
MTATAPRISGRDPSSPDPRDLSAHELDDHRDAVELRNRFEGLLQELRVMLPGVQVLLAFLLTVPFAQRFELLDDAGRIAFGVAIIAAVLATSCLLTPTALHRVGDRRLRSRRLRVSVRFTVAGIVFLGIALCSALWCVARFVFDDVLAAWSVAAVSAVLLGCWFVVPLALSRHEEGADAGRDLPRRRSSER